VGVLLLPGGLLATTYKQPGFAETVVFSGLTNPTTLRFLPDGRVVVAEKSGLIKVFPDIHTNTFTVVADLRTEVHNFWDRGLLGLEIDPNFATNHYVYVLYSHDAAIGGTPPRWGPGDGTSDPCPTPPGPTTDGCVISGHLSRLIAVGNDWTASEQVLLEDWCQQFPSHSIGAIAFGADGMLYLTGGDGASFDNSDWGQFGGTSRRRPTRAETRRFPSARRRPSRPPRAARSGARARGAQPESRAS
jgi:glucose/arabinose dehydrogenase